MKTELPSTLPSLAKSVAALAGSQLFTIAIGFISNIIVGRLYGPVGRGSLAVVGAFWPLISIILTLGVSLGCMQLTAINPKKASDINRTGFGIVGVIYLLFALASPYIKNTSLASGFQHLPASAFWVTSLALPLMLLNGVLEGTLRGLEKFGSIAHSVILSRSMSLVGVLLSYFMFPHDIGPMIFCVVVGEGVRFLDLVRFSIPIMGYNCIKPSINRKVFHDIFRCGLGYYPGSVAAIFNGRADQLVLASFWGPRIAGLYAIAVVASEVTNLSSIAMAQTLMSRIAKIQCEEDRNQLTASFCRLNIILSISAALCVCLAAPLLIPLALGSAFVDSVHLVWLLSPGVIFLGIHRVLSADYAGRGKPMVASAINIATMGLTAILFFLLIPRFGGFGAALSVIIGYGLVALLMIFTITKHRNLRICHLLLPQKQDFAVLLNPLKDRFQHSNRKSITTPIV